jgi:hypothetical protein
MIATLISELSRFQLLVIGTVAILLMYFIVLSIRSGGGEEKLEAKVAGSLCPFCGEILGIHSVELAKQAEEIARKAANEKRRKEKLKCVLPRGWWQLIWCPSCEKKLPNDFYVGLWNQRDTE